MPKMVKIHKQFLLRMRIALIPLKWAKGGRFFLSETTSAVSNSFADYLIF